MKREKNIIAEEPKYKYEDILAAAPRFGVKPEVLAGALHADKKQEYTITEVKAAIEKFKTKEVI